MSTAVEIVTTIALLASSVLMIAVAATWFSDGRRKRPRSRKLAPLLQPQRPDEDRPPAEQGITWSTAAYVVSAGLVGFAVGAVVGELPLRLFAGALVIGVLVPVLGGLCALYLAGRRRSTTPVVATVAGLVLLTSLTVVIPA
ncbi:hypothetical protein IGS67_03965 [Flavimobilis sp. GY10621]|uniref:Uncharacterized protein n=1 Tax=Flavimobilis rhizosphaerae TaxID=2775421 RepID=A0ABR9DQP5_9MICO|nr:hypothetical protein [Flavimobilis rhizosphaerae]MBD9698652.1 hypothetical protein [Flavimobilis rhizosphaerae]